MYGLQWERPASKTDGRSLNQLIAAAALEEGDEIPESVADKPELNDLQEFFYHAFAELNTCRSFDFGGEGPIPWNRIEEYADRSGLLDLDDREEFRLIMRELDKSYRGHVSEKRKLEREAAKGSGKR